MKRKPEVTPRRPGRAPGVQVPALSPEAEAFIRAGEPERMMFEPSAAELQEEREAPKGRSSRARLGAHETLARRPMNAYETPGERSRGAQGALVTRAGGRVVRKTTIHFRPETHAALEAHCRAEGDEVSRVVDRAVREYLARHATGTRGEPT